MNDEFYMKKAIELATLGRYQTFRNPLVGAVIVKDDCVIAAGYHAQYGQAHAERMAIENCTTPEELKNSTLYVTLEPCNHKGKQPPCVSEIIKSGVRRVVIGTTDSNPVVQKKGIQALKQAGVNVTQNVSREACRRLNRYYHYFYEQQRPFITLKQAISLDGKITKEIGTQTTITSAKTKQYVNQERKQYQAIVVGSQTVLVDNPELLSIPVGMYPPIRVILDRRGQLFDFDQYHIFNEPGETWLFTTTNCYTDVPQNTRIIQMDTVSIEAVIIYCTKKGVQSLYVEGGARIHAAFLEAGLYDEVLTYIAPKIYGGQSVADFQGATSPTGSNQLSFEEVTRIGPDLRLVSQKVANV